MNLTTIGDQILILLGTVRDGMSPRAVETFQSYAEELRMLAKVPGNELETTAAPELSEEPKITYEAMEEGLKTILSHAGSAIECVDEPGKTYLREICEIVDHVYGEDTSEEEEEKPEPTPIFGKTMICSIHASMNNPHKVGTYVETIWRAGRMNPGKHYRVTDGKGDFWEVPEDNALIEPSE